MVGFRGNQESFVLGFHPTEPPVVLQRSRALLGRERHDPTAWNQIDRLGLWPYLAGLSALQDGTYASGWGLYGPRFEM
ncbi:MAG: hypothetical protein H6704_10020 [Myxococcales bacterium]|nr:hypothetical protein [Myxococcales bacterium]